MKKINFKELEIYTSIAKNKKVKGDARETFANVLYTGMDGLAAHALAFKIYQSTGEIEVNEQEEELIRTAAAKCTPAFMDGVIDQLNQE